MQHKQFNVTGLDSSVLVLLSIVFVFERVSLEGIMFKRYGTVGGVDYSILWDFIVWSITNITMNIKKLKGIFTTTRKAVKMKEKTAAIIMRAINKKSSNVGVKILNSLRK